MSRIRTIKPEFWTSEQVMECSPLARLLFIGLWNFCDDNGVHPASCKTLKAEIFPADDITVQQVTDLIGELIGQGLLGEFEHEGKRYWFVTGWHHQRIDRPSPAKHPHPPKINRTFVEDSTRTRRGLDEDSTNARDGREGKGIVIENTPHSFFPKHLSRARVAESVPEETAKKEKNGGDDFFVSPNFKPKTSTLDVLAGMQIPESFAAEQAAHFALYHAEAGTQRKGGFESLFVGWVKRAWEKRPPDPSAEPVYTHRPRHMTLNEWADYQGRIAKALEPIPDKPEPDPFPGVFGSRIREIPVLEGDYERTH